MENYDLIIEMLKRAKAETEAHKQSIKEHPYWYSQHMSKAKRAITTARELLLEASKELSEE
jgi:preprotein translocase subunit SecA